LTTPLQAFLELENASITGMSLATLTQKSIASKTKRSGEFAHIVELSSILMTLGVSWSWVTMSAALATSLLGIQWFSKAEILLIVKAMLLAVALDTGIAGTTPLMTLSISTTSSSFGLRFLSAITVSTSTHLWLVIGPSHESSFFRIVFHKKNQEGYFQVFCKYLRNRRTKMDNDRVNKHFDGGRPDIPS